MYITEYENTAFFSLPVIERKNKSHPIEVAILGDFLCKADGMLIGDLYNHF
jgi:hypothetical protein